MTGDGGLVQGWQADPQGNVNTNSSPGTVKIPVGQTISPVTTSSIKRRRQPARRLGSRYHDRRLDRREQLAGRIGAVAHGVHEGRRLGRAASTGRSRPSTAPTRRSRARATCSSTPTATSRRGTSPSRRRSSTPSRARRARGRPAARRWTSVPRPRPIASRAPRRSTASPRCRRTAPAIGSLVSFSVGQDGLISGVFSNGRTQALGQIALATFAEPGRTDQAGRLPVSRRRPTPASPRSVSPASAAAARSPAERSRARTSTSARSSPT